MRKQFSKLALTASIMLAMAFTLSACSMDIDDDEIRINCSSGSPYIYRFYNYSSYEVKVTWGKQTKTLTRTNSTGSFFTSSSHETFKYSPTDKVRYRTDNCEASFSNK